MAFMIPRKRFGSGDPAGQTPSTTPTAAPNESMARSAEFSTPYKRFTLEEATNALEEVLVIVTNPDLRARLDPVKQFVGEDPAKVVAHVMPKVVEIFSKVIKLFGFPPGQSGTIQFMLAIREHTRDPGVRAKVSKIAECFFSSEMMHMAEAMIGGALTTMN